MEASVAAGVSLTINRACVRAHLLNSAYRACSLQNFHQRDLPRWPALAPLQSRTSPNRGSSLHSSICHGKFPTQPRAPPIDPCSHPPVTRPTESADARRPSRGAHHRPGKRKTISGTGFLLRIPVGPIKIVQAILGVETDCRGVSAHHRASRGFGRDVLVRIMDDRGPTPLSALALCPCCRGDLRSSSLERRRSRRTEPQCFPQ